MGNINRIRVNNVKYNFGTQFYDDFLMRMSGKNTIYDLANGGGKSILMLLLMQNMIPNCTLDEKQPIEKLFRSGCGNTVIHSMVEWNLSENCIENHYRYMLTGFCARKASAGEAPQEEEEASASVEYFNYVIFYREMNDHDIKNFPLTRNGERVTYSGLKNYLRDLEKKDLSLKVKVFDRKGDYQRFVSRYGIYGSEWEIIRGINKTEGHVRTYFETNYKTTRKIVEDLLIEEIIQKSFQTNQTRESDLAGEETMAQTLLDIKDKLLELSKRKHRIHNYDRQIELLNIFADRAQSIRQMYDSQRQLEDNIVKVYHTVKARKGDNEKRREQLRLKTQELQSTKLMLAAQLEAAKAEENKRKLEEYHQEILLLERDKQSLEQEQATLEQEQCLRESANDYLDYEYYRQKREEVAQTIAHMQQGKEELLRKLYRLAVLKKQKNNKEKERILVQIDQLSQKEEELGIAVEKCDCQERELDRQNAVLSQEISRMEGEENYLKEEFGTLRNEKGVLMAGSIREEESRCRRELEEIGKQKEELEIKKQEWQEAQVKLRIEIGENALALSRMEEQIDKYNYEDNREYEVKKRIQVMQDVYGEQELGELHMKMKERYQEQLVRIAQIKQDIRGKQEYLKCIQSGKSFVDRPEIETVFDYIERYHSAKVEKGSDYLLGLDLQEAEELLERFPVLPYCILVEEGLLELVADNRLKQLDLQDAMVLLVDKKALEQGRELLDISGIVVAAHDKEIFLAKDKQLILLQKLAEQVESEEKEYRQRAEGAEVVMEDIQFLVHYQMQRRQTGELEKVSFESLHKRQKELLNEKEHLQKRKAVQGELWENIKQQERDVSDRQTHWEKELDDFLRLSELYQKLNEIQTKLVQKKQEEQKGEKEQQNVKARLQALRNQYDRQVERRKQSQQQLQDIDQEWKSEYQPYYRQDLEEDELIAEAQRKKETRLGESSSLEAEFKGVKHAMQSENSQTADKEKLMENYDMAMEKTMQAIDYKGYSFERLRELAEAGQLYRTETEQLLEWKKKLEELGKGLKQKEKELRSMRSRQDKLEGSIERNIQEIVEKYGSYPQIGQQELGSYMEEKQQLLTKTKEEKEELQEQYKELESEEKTLLIMENDLDRMVAQSEVNVSCNSSVWENHVQLEEAFSEISKKFEAFRVEIFRRREEFDADKQQLLDTLSAMEAVGLAQEVKKNIQMPQSMEETECLLENIKEVNSCLQLEKEQVVRGIEDMERMKINFRSQCLQTCINIKIELDRLAKLSKIMLDGESISMLRLQIPYIKEEAYEREMEVYIDQIIETAEGMNQNQDKLKYIRSQLAWKKLFSVIVTDMNRIRLSLYKRERIKEQSRYLRYEEAVGSTGQSQGIYIQFLIAIVNYITSIHSRDADATKLKKVIFIDNPFGAAKDVYIWEPIFQLLKTNHVQLIVPARGTTPAITGRFDVNYILGQKLINGRQQTVVVDYISSVSQEELEYTAISYEQASLF